MSNNTHIPYFSLEQFRNALVNKYLEIYKNDVIVQEKIHGSNILIFGKYISGIWFFELGSRKRWVQGHEKFNNLQNLFKAHETQIRDLFLYIVEHYNLNNATVRIYGEVFGGKYGQETSKNSFKTQKEPNYGPNNDFAFFDIFVKDLDDETSQSIHIPILEAINLFEKFNLKTPPIVFKGQLNKFLSSFDVNKFQSIVSKEFYDLPYIHGEKATEGVVIRSINPTEEDEEIVLKYKQTWAVENRRVMIAQPKKLSKNSDLENSCLDMMNLNRIESYNSKNTIDDITNPRLIGKHVKEIVQDTLKDIKDEFPNDKYPELDLKKINSLLSKKAFPLFKTFVTELNNSTKTPDERMNILIKEHSNLVANINILTSRINIIMERIVRAENM